MTSHTRPWKEQEVQEIIDLSKKYPVVAVANLSLFPADLFSRIRKKLHGKAVVKVSKTRVIRKAFEGTALKDSDLLNHIKGMCGIVFTEMNPFELASFLRKNKGSAYAKEGSIAPNDILIPAGDTGIPPGPALSELKNAGLKVKVQGPTIQITEDKVVAKKGDSISLAVANTLAKLDIKPIKIGLNLEAVLENGAIFLPEVLDIDSEKMQGQFESAVLNSLKLAVEVSYFSKQSMPLILRKAVMNSKALALEANILTKQTSGMILAKANAQANALKSLIKE